MQRPVALLSHLRWVSAGLVAFSHFRNLLMADFHGGSAVAKAFYFVTGFGHSSVVVFFALSGFLVGAKIRRMVREPDPDLGRYLVDRFSRIFVVAWPAVGLSLIALLFVLALAPTAPYVTGGGWSAALQAPLGQDLSGGRWLGLSGLTNELLSPTPAINGPLWSLACEWSYYIVAGAGVALIRRRWSWLIPYAAVLLVVAALRDQEMVIGGGVWLLGMLASHAADRAWLRSRLSLISGVVLAAAAFTASRVLPVPDLALGAAIALLISHTAWRQLSFGEAVGERLAAYSYTLYATHFPLAVLCLAALGLRRRLEFGPGTVAIVAGAFALSLVIARGIAFVTEDRTSAVRDALLTWRGPRASAPVVG